MSALDFCVADVLADMIYALTPNFAHPETCDNRTGYLIKVTLNGVSLAELRTADEVVDYIRQHFTREQNGEDTP